MLIGQRISHYQVLEKLGAGGMGEVYKARDTHLDRSVAIKVLRAERVSDPERKRRFVQEAKAASALNHPNIVTIYDIDTDQGVDFIAMEYLEGQPLDRVLAGRRLPLEEALDYAVKIEEYWLDNYEVTNRQFKEFVNAGGYQKREYWKQPFVKDGKTLSWEQAMAEFRDATGRPDPVARRCRLGSACGIRLSPYREVRMSAIRKAIAIARPPHSAVLSQCDGSQRGQ